MKKPKDTSKTCENEERIRLRAFYDMVDDALLESRFSDVNNLFRVSVSDADRPMAISLLRQTLSVSDDLVPDRHDFLGRWIRIEAPG